ncbi:sensor histidine kinase [Bacteroidota bacterium]
MRSISAKHLVFLVSLAISFSCALLVGGTIYLASENPPIIILGSAIISLTISFLLIYFTLNILFNKKIKPIIKEESHQKTESMDVILEVNKLRNLEKYRKEFLGNVSHELKTPIFNIQGYILTLLDGGLEDPRINREYLKRTEKSINRMVNIVDDLESITKLETGELELELEDFDVVSLVRDVYDLQDTNHSKYKIKLVFDRNYEKPIMVNGDKKKITEVLNNLIVNSIYYGERGGKTTVSFKEKGKNILVDVSDNGIGIAKEEIPLIFERFYRTDRSRSGDRGGTGLGLAIVKHIIEAHRQNIRVRSEPGKGSSFFFTLKKA